MEKQIQIRAPDGRIASIPESKADKALRRGWTVYYEEQVINSNNTITQTEEE